MMADGDSFLKEPTEQAFWQYLSLGLNAVGAMDRRKWGLAPAPKIIIVIGVVMHTFTPVVCISQVVYWISNSDDIPLYQLGTMLIFLPTVILINVKLHMDRSKNYKTLMYNFIKEIHLYNFNTNEFSKMILIKTEKYTRWVICGLLFCLGSDLLLWCTIPVLLSIQNKELISNGTMKLQTSLYMYMPFDYERNYMNWMIMHAINSYCFFVGCTVILISDGSLSAAILHLIGHVKIFKNNIKEFSKNFKSCRVDDVELGLRELIKYHIFLIGSFRKVQTAFGLNVSANYLFNLVVDSIIVFQIMTADRVNVIVYSGFLAIFIGGLFSMSLILEELRRQSTDISDLVYDMPWEEMSLKNQKILIFLLAMSQQVLAFRAAGGMETGLRPMLSIIKSTFSYYVMLKSTL